VVAVSLTKNLMAQARHVGKVVITQPARPVASGIRGEGSYLITGAFGGIGLELARWLVEQGAKSLVLVARSAANPSPDAQQLLQDCQEKGVACLPLALDLAGAAAAEPLATALQDFDLRGVFHAAGMLDDGLLEWQTPQRLAGVLAPKWGGWQTIETALQRSGLDPELVVQFSSMAALLGSPGQSNYGASNGALDGAMAFANRPGWMSLQWGPWAGGGMAGALEERQKQRLEALGVRLLEPNLALEALGELIARGASGAIGVLDVDWARIARNAGSRQGAPLEIMAATAEQDSAEAPSGPPPTVALLLETPVAERRSLLQGFVQQQLAKVMGVADPDQIDPGEPLFNMGLDSLMALELMVLLEKNLGFTLTEALVFEHPTIEDLVAYFLSVLFPEQAAAPAAAVTPAPVVPESADQAWDEQLQAVAELDEDELLRQLQGGS